MVSGRKITVIALLLVFLFVSACARYHYEGGAAGGVVGGAAGALLDRKNPWRGGVIGATLGALFGATVSDVAARGAQEAARTNRPVEYTTENGRGVYRAEPVGADERTNCKKVRERIWEDERLVKDRIKEVCEGEKTERRY
ncbi:MAG: glycine zipper 2TM domain-containing protein [Alphaproteobacteria bacterium]|uniref:Glycine zipper 2TM domain-containing protein n=1 Tax=Candidatus Nitrobium versatile TaxID=2884831 RepID=A0A953JE36_9BACT|nr:glycine zipper 2TM domain-containing protein [Candidatus Nitrobium versatile]